MLQPSASWLTDEVPFNIGEGSVYILPRIHAVVNSTGYGEYGECEWASSYTSGSAAGRAQAKLNEQELEVGLAL